MNRIFTNCAILALGSLFASCSNQKEQVKFEELQESIIEQVSENKGDAIFMQNDKFAENMIIKKNDGTYSILNKEGNERFSDLRFAKSISWEFAQLLDQTNNVILLNGDLKRVEKAKTMFGFCGTVPHYTMAIVEEGNDFIITSDETFFDHDQKEPAKEIWRFSKEIVDHLEFISGSQEFRYDSNFGIGEAIQVEPRTILANKNGKWAIPTYSQEYSDEQFKEFYAKELSFIYDSVFLHSNVIKTQLDGLFGYHGISAPKYTVLQSFDHHLARFDLPNGQTGFIDTNGNEYFD